MPSDKHHNATPGKPFTPTLSSAFKSSKSPLTPRLAGSVTPNSSNIFRRGANIDSASTPNLVRKDSDFSTPVSAFLNSNVTPRSGSRKARVDTTPSTPVRTPTGTPVHSRATSTVEATSKGLEHGKEWTGLGITAYDGKIGGRTRSGIIDTGDTNSNGRPGSADGRRGSQDIGSPIAGPLFFHADDAKSAVSGQEPNVKPVLRAKPATFFYANGVTEEPTRSRSISSQDDPPSKFVHAKGNASVRSPPPRALTLQSAPPPKQTIPNRPPSPLKETYPAKPSPAHSRTLSRPNSRPQGTPPPQNESANPQQQPCAQTRRLSTGSSKRQPSHSKSGSVGSTSSGPSQSSSLKLSPKGTPTSTILSSNVVSSIPRASPVPSPHVQSPSGPLSPTKSSESSHAASLPQQSDLAASARRERKVLDLEISNSSLLAINRTLEREMRKQTAELRRYRRLSRSGRLSIAPGPSSRAVSGLTTVSELDIDDPSSLFNPSPSSPTTSEFSLDLSPSSSDDESSLVTDDSPLSPAAQAAYDGRHRRRDEARLHLDLSKHQQLLIDSQKMNQSIRRCLGWTEELIKEGKKALEYSVKVSDVELGGKVLVPEEVEVDGESRDEEDAIGGGRLLSPSLDVERVFWSGAEPDASEEDIKGSIETFNDELLIQNGDAVLGDNIKRRSIRDSSPFILTPIEESSRIHPKAPPLLD